MVHEGRNKTRAMVIPLCIFAIATGAIFLGGLAAAQSYCGPSTGQAVRDPAEARANGLNTEGTSGVFGWSGNVLACNQLYRFAWFTFAFLFVSLIGLLVCAATKHALGTALHYTRPFWIGMLAVNTLLFMIMSEAFLAAVSSTGIASLAAYRAAAAGAICTVVALVFLMFAVGTHWDYNDHGEQKTYREDVSPYGTTATPATTTTTTTAPGTGVDRV